MKKTLLAIARGLAIMPLTLAQTAPATPPANGSQPEAPKTKKGTKKHKKGEKKTTTSSAAAKHSAVKSAAPATTPNPAK
jgi:hypothetical protein